MQENKAVIIDNEGKIIPLGNITDILHAIPLLDYAKAKYPNSVFSKLDYMYGVHAINYYLQDLGNIIFLNTSKKIGHNGILILPKEYENRVGSINDMLSNFEGFHLYIQSNLRLEDGIPIGDETYPLEGESPVTTFNRFLDSREIKR